MMYLPSLDEILDQTPLIVSPQTPLLEVLAQMSCVNAQGQCSPHQASHSGVLIMEGDRLLGIFTERDVMGLTARDHDFQTTTISEVMTPNPITLNRSEFKDIFGIISCLRTHHIRHLPLVDDCGKLEGLLSQDVLRESLQPEHLLRLRDVSEVMVRDILTLDVEAIAIEAIELMAKHHTSCIVICQQGESPNDPQKYPVGILTERDILQYRLLNLDFKTYTALELSSSPPLCLKTGQSLWLGYQQMQKQRVRRLLVIGKQGELLGLITQSTILNALTPLALYETINVLQERIGTLEEEKIQLLQQQTQQLQGEVEQQTQTLQEQATQAQLLANLAAKIRQSLNLDRILNTIVQEIRQSLNCDRVFIAKLQSQADHSSAKIVAESLPPEDSSRLGRSLWEFSSSSTFPQQPHSNPSLAPSIIRCDIRCDPHLKPAQRQRLHRLPLAAEISILLCEGDRPWGILCLQQSQQPRTWKPWEVDLLQNLVVQIAIALQQAQLYKQAQQELRERQAAQTRLIEKEKEYRSLVENASDLIFRMDRSLHYLYVNPAFEKLTEQTAQEWIGKTPEAMGIDPQVIKHWQNSFKQILLTHQEVIIESPFPTLDGPYWFQTRLFPEFNSDREIKSFFGIARDITARKHTETQLRHQAKSEQLINQTAQKIRQSLNLDRILDTTVTEIQQLLHCDRLIVYQFTDATRGIITAEATASGVEGILHRSFEDNCFGDVYQNVYLQGYHTLTSDIENRTNLDPCYQAMLRELKVKANLVVPILLREERPGRPAPNTELWGLLIAHHCREPHPWDANEIQLLQDIALQLAIAIQQAQLYQQVQSQLQERCKAETALRELNEDLESRVQQRTQELAQRDRYLSGIVEIQRHLIATSIPDYDTILAILGRIATASRVYIFHTHAPEQGTLRVSQVAEWCAEGVISHLDDPNLQNFPLETTPTILSCFQAGQCYSGNVADLSYPERSILDSQGILSIALVPICLNRNTHLFGFIGFDRCDRTCPWSDLEITLLQSVSRSIALAKERQDMETALRNSREQLQSLLESLREIIFQVDENGTWIFLNAAWETITGFSVAESLGQPFWTYIHPKSRSTIHGKFRKFRQKKETEWGNKRLKTELQFHKKNGEVCWLEIDVIAMENSQSTFIGLSGILNDITERKLAQAERDHSQQRLEMALDAVKHGVWEWDVNNNHCFFSRRYYTMLGYQPDDFSGSFDTWKSLTHPDDLERVLPIIREAISTNTPFAVEFRMKRQSGDWCWIQSMGSPYHYRGASEDQTISNVFVGTHVDITERKDSEAELKQNLKEKEILLKEIHHRVKNNLLVVASLLEFQSDYSDNTEIHRALQDSQNRVLSMSLIHERLYQSTDLSHIEFRDYLETLIEQLFASYNIDSHKITYTIHSEPIRLNIETAHPCGLIINEIISNVLKHAFPDARTGTVEILVNQEPTGLIHLRIKDNGIGIPEHIDLFKTDSLGMELIVMLVEQIRGEIHLNRQQGTEFHMTFSELQYKRRV